jgi:hypothetical protein
VSARLHHPVKFSLAALLADGADMPRERFQEPTIQRSKNGSYFIRVWMDVITEKGLDRRKKTINLGAADALVRDVKAAKKSAMETINRASYVLQSQVPFSAMLDEYETRHVARLAFSTQGKYKCHLKNHKRGRI